jgi:formyltetrahydrofolate hydrolase
MQHSKQHHYSQNMMLTVQLTIGNHDIIKHSVMDYATDYTDIRLDNTNHKKTNLVEYS